MTWKLMEDCTKARLGNDVSRAIGRLTQPEKLANDCGSINGVLLKVAQSFLVFMGWEMRSWRLCPSKNFNVFAFEKDERTWKAAINEVTQLRQRRIRKWPNSSSRSKNKIS